MFNFYTRWRGIRHLAVIYCITKTNILLFLLVKNETFFYHFSTNIKEGWTLVFTLRGLLCWENKEKWCPKLTARTWHDICKSRWYPCENKELLCCLSVLDNGQAIKFLAWKKRRTQNMAALGLLMVLPSLAFAGYRCANPLVQLRDSLMLFLSFMKIRVFGV